MARGKGKNGASAQPKKRAIVRYMLPWYTGKPCEHTKRSHINMCVFDNR